MELLETGGPGVGAVWTARPDVLENWLSSTQWRTAAQLRLGVWSDEDDLRCNYKDRQDEVCDRPITRGPAVLALDSRNSPSRIRLHSATCKAPQEQLRRAGAEVESECPMPELSRW